MPERPTIRTPVEKARETANRQADRDLLPDRLVRGLGQLLRRGKAFLWIWTLVTAVLVAMSVSTILTTSQPNGIDFNWSG
jgi:hypothetical protein